MIIPGIPDAESTKVLELIERHPRVHRVVLYGSRDAVREAVVRELISAGSEVTWMAMIRSRNLTSHTYNPSVAQDIAALIRERYAQELTALQRELRRRAEAL